MIRSTGPNVTGGQLFYRLAEGSTLVCTCIKGPFADEIVQMFDRAKDRARRDVASQIVAALRSHGDGQRHDAALKSVPYVSCHELADFIENGWLK